MSWMMLVVGGGQSVHVDIVAVIILLIYQLVVVWGRVVGSGIGLALGIAGIRLGKVYLVRCCMVGYKVVLGRMTSWIGIALMW